MKWARFEKAQLSTAGREDWRFTATAFQKNCPEHVIDRQRHQMSDQDHLIPENMGGDHFIHWSADSGHFDSTFLSASLMIRRKVFEKPKMKLTKTIHPLSRYTY